MTDFALEATTAPSSAALIESAGRHISAVIGLERCTWMEGTDLGVSTLLLPDGSLMGPLSDLGADRAHLPAQCAMPVGVENLHLGGFRLTPRPDAIVSAEERRTAAAIGQLLAAHLAARPTV